MSPNPRPQSPLSPPSSLSALELEVMMPNGEGDAADPNRPRESFRSLQPATPACLNDHALVTSIAASPPHLEPHATIGPGRDAFDRGGWRTRRRTHLQSRWRPQPRAPVRRDRSPPRSWGAAPASPVSVPRRAAVRAATRFVEGAVMAGATAQRSINFPSRTAAQSLTGIVELAGVVACPPRRVLL